MADVPLEVVVASEADGASPAPLDTPVVEAFVEGLVEGLEKGSDEVDEDGEGFNVRRVEGRRDGGIWMIYEGRSILRKRLS